MEKIIAVIVSHNRHTLLTECINAIRNQSELPNTILVVNNGSSDYTSVWLDKQTDVIQLYQENAGPAGGYHTGIKWAFENGYDFIWCMDDDSCPKYNALEMLFKHRGPNVELLNSVVINNADKSSFVWKTKNYSCLEEVKSDVIEGISQPFNGTLIHRSIIEKAGLPKSNLFYWGEGSEYFYRVVNKFKIPAKTVTSSIQYHPQQNIGMNQEWDLKTSWKMYFFVRNRYQVLKSKYNNPIFACIYYCCFVFAFSCIMILKQKENKLKKASFAFWPMIHAFTGNYSANDISIQIRLREISTSPITSSILKSISKFLRAVFVPSENEVSKTATA